MPNKVKVVICGKTYLLQSEESQSYMTILADSLDKKINEFMDDNESASLTTAAVMVGLALLDDANKSTGDVDNFRAQIKGYVEEAANARIEADRLKKELKELKAENASLKSDLEFIKLKDNVQ